MNRVLNIYKMMLKYYKLMAAGLVTMFVFAIFSGFSLTIVVPLFDNIFTVKTVEPVIVNYEQFSASLAKILSEFWQNVSIGQIFDYDFFADKVYRKELIGDIGGQLSTLLDTTASRLVLYLVSFATIFLMFFKNVFYFLNKIIFSELRGRTIMDIRNRVFKKYIFHSVSFLAKRDVGDSQVRIFSDVQIISDMFIISLFNSMRDVTLVFIYSVLAMMMNPKLFLIVVFVLPLFTIVIGLIGNKIKKYAKRIQKQVSTMFGTIQEVLYNIKIVKVFSKEQHEMAKFEELSNRYFKFWRKSVLYNATNVPISEMNSVLTGVLVLILGGGMVLDNPEEFSFGSFFAFLMLVFSILHPLKSISKAFNNIKKAMVSLDRVSEILEQEEEIQDPANPVKKENFEKEIEFKNVVFGYDKDKTVIKGLNLQIKKGEQVAFVGNSGSGKTTLTGLLVRLFDVNEGEILFDGLNIKEMTQQNLRSLFGTVTQESMLFSDTVANNIAYGTNKKVTEQDIVKAAEIAYADEFIESFPDRYNHILEARGSNLSGGQKQRLCIARAIVGNPPILIFDEATSALDTVSEDRVQKAIDKATANRTVIVVAHRLSTILSSDKIVVLDQGEIVGIGKNEELLGSCPQYKKLYDLQFKRDNI